MLLALAILLFVVLYFTTPFTIGMLIEEVDHYLSDSRRVNYLAGASLLMLVTGFLLWLNFALMLYQAKSIVFFPYIGIITPAWFIFVAIATKSEESTLR
jgi:hypothetical protein